jgi:RNA polymerase sigma-70 factor (ECF subfamily)
VNATTARARVAAILDALPPRQRALLALMLVERMTAAETAGALDTTTGEVETAYRSVLSTLGRGLASRRPVSRARRSA